MDFFEFVKIAVAIVTVVSALGSVIVWFYQWAFTRGVKQAEQNKEMLEKVYGPLGALFLDTYLCSTAGARYPYLKLRLKRAKHFLLSKNYKQMVYAIFNKGFKNYGTEVEYGSLPPMEKVYEIIEQNTDLLDEKLLEFYQHMRREELEYIFYGNEYPPYFLTDSYLAFFNHIFHMRKKLKKIFDPR